MLEEKDVIEFEPQKEEILHFVHLLVVWTMSNTVLHDDEVSSFHSTFTKKRGLLGSIFNSLQSDSKQETDRKKSVLFGFNMSLTMSSIHDLVQFNEKLSKQENSRFFKCKVLVGTLFGECVARSANSNLLRRYQKDIKSLSTGNFETYLSLLPTAARSFIDHAQAYNKLKTSEEQASMVFRQLYGKTDPAVHVFGSRITDTRNFMISLINKFCSDIARRT